MDEWKVITGGGFSGLLLVFYYLKSVNSSLKDLIQPIRDLQGSIGELNVKMATIISDRSSDKEMLDELRRDVKHIQLNCTACARNKQ